MDNPDDQPVLKYDSFDNATRKAREVLRAKGLTEEIIESLLERQKVDDLAMPPSSTDDAEPDAR